MIHIFLLFFLILTLILNFLLTYMFPLVGLFTSSITVIIYLLIAVYDFYDTEARDIFSLSVTFLLLNFVNIFFHFSDIYINMLIMYAILLFISLIFCLKIFHEKRFFRLKNITHIYIILPIGILLGLAIYYFLGFSQFSLVHITLQQAVGLIVLIGVSEEIFFRALLQNAVTKMTDTFIAITFTSILFGLFHFSTNIFATVLYILLSLMSCVTYSIWKNIYITIALNSIINITFYLVTSHLLLFAIR